MHAAGVELDYALFIRQSAQANAVIGGIVLRAGDHGDGSIQRVRALAQAVVTGIGVLETIVCANDDVLRTRRSRARCRNRFVVRRKSAGERG